MALKRSKTREIATQIMFHSQVNREKVGDSEEQKFPLDEPHDLESKAYIGTPGENCRNGGIKRSRSLSSVGANTQTFGVGKVRYFSNIMKNFGRSWSRFGNLPACVIDIHWSMKVSVGGW